MYLNPYFYDFSKNSYNFFNFYSKVNSYQNGDKLNSLFLEQPFSKSAIVVDGPISLKASPFFKNTTCCDEDTSLFFESKISLLPNFTKMFTVLDSLRKTTDTNTANIASSYLFDTDKTSKIRYNKKGRLFYSEKNYNYRPTSHF